MDEIRTFMAGRHAPFRLKGLRAIFVTPEDEVEKEDKVCVICQSARPVVRQCFQVFTAFP